MVQAPQTAPDRSAWQFSLRTLMIGVTLVALVVSSGMWLDGAGVLGCIFLIGLGLLGYAVYARRKRLLLATSVFLPVLVAGIAIIYFFGPYTVAAFECDICGRGKGTLWCYKLTIYQKEYETERSEWYRQKKLGPHEHRWIYLHSYQQNWGGSGEDGDSFGLRLCQLKLFIKASEKVDRTAFEQMAKEYDAIGTDSERGRNFREKCRTIIDAPTGESADK
jgi:hypothetical protein